MSETVKQALDELVESAVSDARAGTCLIECWHPSCQRRRNEAARMVKLGHNVSNALAAVSRERDSMRAQLESSQAETVDWRANALRENAMLVKAQQRIAELEGALEDVRRVEADIRSNALHRLMVDSLGNMAMFTYGNAKFASADSLTALGRMLKDTQAQNTEGENG